MEYDAAIAIGTALAALGGLLERKGICTKMELAEALGERAGRARYLGAWAYMVRVAGDGDDID